MEGSSISIYIRLRMAEGGMEGGMMVSKEEVGSIRQ